ncbi:MAG: sulfatase-like hydrolase/transferase, partial [Bacteroidales bacterium]|nr:sulfatase-like hydrolase/transferase [Bacteroidales bacterium]
VCSPTRCSVLTGRNPYRSGVFHANRGILRPEEVTIPELLKERGYATGHFGKWHMGGQRDVINAPEITSYGFDESVTNFEGMGPKLLPWSTIVSNGDTIVKKPWKEEDLGGPFEYVERAKITGSFADSAIQFIDKAQLKGAPFYVNVWPDDVHTPMYPSFDRWSPDLTIRYLAVLEQMDAQFGKLFQRIKNDAALRDNTIILICSDNGPDKDCGSAGAFKGLKSTLYEGGIRSPLIVWAPGFIDEATKGSVNDSTVFAAIDIAPSVLNIAEIDVPDEINFDGENMGNTLLGKSPVSRSNPIFFRRPPDREEAYWFTELPDLAVRSGDWKLLCDHGGLNPQLYKVVDDPGETTNLATQNEVLVDSLTKLVLDWNKTMPRDAGVPIDDNKTELDKDSIVFYLPFDNNVDDLSGNQVAFAQDNGAVPTFETGMFGNAVKLDKMRFITEKDSVFNPYNTHTFAAWIKLSTLPKTIGKSMTCIHQLNDPNNNDGRVHLEVMTNVLGTNNAITSFTGGVKDERTAYSTSAQTNTWYHVACVWDRERMVKLLYINGNQIDNKSITSIEQCFGKFVIGANKLKANPFLGQMDDLILVKQALGTKAIQKIMEIGVSASLSSLKRASHINHLSIYPNPSNGELTIKLNASDELVSYTLYNLSGQVVTEGLISSSIQIDLKGMNKGVYLFKHKLNGISTVEKIILQ